MAPAMNPGPVLAMPVSAPPVPAGGWPRISIVTPSFNQHWALERTLRSVLDQQYPNLEYIVMDGGSTDGSVDVISRYANQLSHWQSARDGGQSAAVIAGFARASGDVFGWLNSDDVLEPGSLHALGHAFANGAQWVVGWSRLIDEHDRELMRRSTMPVTLAQLVRHRYVLPQESTFYTRDIYQKAGGLDPTYNFALDAHLWMRMMSLAEPVWMDRFLGCFRAHSEQKTSQMSRYWQEFTRATTEIDAWRSAQGLPPVGLCPCSETAFKWRKIRYYGNRTGLTNLVRIWNFHRKFRS